MMLNKWRILVFLLCAIFNIVIGTIEPMRKHEICLNYSGRRVYLEAHEQGILQATNVSIPNYKNVSIFLCSIKSC